MPVDCLGELRETEIANTLHARWKTVYTSDLSQNAFLSAQRRRPPSELHKYVHRKEVQGGPLMDWVTRKISNTFDKNRQFYVEKKDSSWFLKVLGALLKF